ncbi:MAG TPA: SAM-dependent methyltransferase [Candidatus Acidoferrum sp.]|nr:SAM-dependent methyltransferase [Candidatus Acidoferrum sp.]
MPHGASVGLRYEQLAVLELPLQEGRWLTPVAGLPLMQTPTMKGTIYILGAGSGDPEFLTAQAVNILRTAEVVLHDESVSSKILDLIPASTQVRNVHKLVLLAGTLQEKINSLMITAAGEGHLVVRLVANDPSQSLLADEAVEALTQAGIAFELLPGAAIAIGAAAGNNLR